MLICEELFLLLITPGGAPDVWISNQKVALGGALLTDMATSGHIDFSDGKNPHVVLASKRVRKKLDNTNPVIENAVEELAKRPQFRTTHIVASSWFSPKRPISEHLSHKGVLHRLHAFRSERYQILDPEPRKRIQDRLTSILINQQSATPEDTVLLILLHQINAIGRTLPKASGQASSAEIRQRIKELTHDIDQNATPALAAVRRSIDAIQSTMATAAFVTLQL